MGAELTPDFRWLLAIQVEKRTASDLEQGSECGGRGSPPIGCSGAAGHLRDPVAPFPELSCSHKGAAKSSKGGETSNFKMHPFIWFHISKLNFNDSLGKCVPLCVSINRSLQCYMFLFYYRRS